MKWGDVFVESRLGEWLRHGIRDPSVLSMLSTIAMPATELVDAALTSVLAHFTMTSGTAPSQSPISSHITIFMPIDNGKAATVALVLFGIPLVAIGNTLPSPCGIQPVIHFHPLRTPD